MCAIYCRSHPSHLKLPFAVSHFLSDSIICPRIEVVSAPTHQTSEESRIPGNYCEGSIPASHYLLFLLFQGTNILVPNQDSQGSECAKCTYANYLRSLGAYLLLTLKKKDEKKDFL